MVVCHDDADGPGVGVGYMNDGIADPEVAGAVVVVPVDAVRAEIEFGEDIGALAPGIGIDAHARPMLSRVPTTPRVFCCSR